jgi:amino acid transporter
MKASDSEAIDVAIGVADSTSELPEPPPKKAFTWWSILAAGYNVCNSWLVFVATMTISLPYGPMNTIWGLLVTTLGYTWIGLTLAELVSAFPTAGGQYHWTYLLAPLRMKRSLVRSRYFLLDLSKDALTY